MKYEYASFPVGTTEQVDVMSDVSCCSSGVRIRAVDLAGNEVSPGDGWVGSGFKMCVFFFKLQIEGAWLAKKSDKKGTFFFISWLKRKSQTGYMLGLLDQSMFPRFFFQKKKKN